MQVLKIITIRYQALDVEKIQCYCEDKQFSKTSVLKNLSLFTIPFDNTYLNTLENSVLLGFRERILVLNKSLI